MSVAITILSDRVPEWKVDQDMQNDTHRHLSHLIGLYPGYAITSFESTLQGDLLVNGSRTTYTKSQVMDAATTSLIHRGNGTGPDADSGWEKMCTPLFLHLSHPCIHDGLRACCKLGTAPECDGILPRADGELRSAGFPSSELTYAAVWYL